MATYKKISKLSDKELLSLYKNSGDSICFGELYSRYIPLLYGVALKYLGNANDAKDAVASLYETLLKDVAKSEIHSLRSFIYSAIKEHCSQVLHKNNELFVDFTENIEGKDEILQLLNEKEIKNRIRKFHVEQRVSILRFFYDEMSYQDIADSTGYKLAKVKYYIKDGLVKLS